ncbi:universal stress protein [Marinobacter halotolerans]|uniref:universal stress protein n=1 Tax=Marinobacter halotolerans TaxID=1569211 RepID=UPI001248B97E|nr:universal stress protein [Marinobacter halotolerans]
MSNQTPCIVVACDGSEHSIQAAKMGEKLATALNQPLKLLAVFPGSKAERLVFTGVWPADIEQEQQDFGENAFKAAKEVINIDPDEEVVLRGHPVEEISDYLEEHPGAHMVLGRRGNSMARSLVMGSISEGVVRHAKGPVTVVSQ